MKRIITCMVMIFMSITICAQKDISQKNKTNIENKHTMGNGNSLIEKQRQYNKNRQKMSIDSLLKFTTKYIVDELRKANMTVIKTDTIEPQVWFTDNSGEKQYVIIHTVCANIPNSANYKFNVPLMENLSPFKGFYARVGLFSGDAIMFNDKGELVPLGERDDINHPVDIIYKDTEIYIMFEGFHPIVPKNP